MARNITALSDICFAAEIDVPPEVVTHLLVSYARLEIEAADRLRAATGPRTRAAAEAALAMEAELRASLREAIFLCDHSQAVDPIKLTADRLGLDLDENDEDYTLLCEKMLRMQIEISEERERRAQGHFGERQPYLGIALSKLHSKAAAPAEALESGAAAAAIRPSRSVEIAAPTPVVPTASPDDTSRNETMSKSADADPSTDTLLDEGGVTVRYRSAPPSSDGQTAQEAGPRLLDLWDDWFEYGKKGGLYTDGYEVEDEALGERFEKNADTLEATRRILSDVFGNRPVLEISEREWKDLNHLLHRLPKSHGKSSADRSLSYPEIVKKADGTQRKQVAAANKKISAQNIQGDEKEELLRAAKIERLSPRTVQRHQRTLSRILNFAVDSGKLSGNPYRKLVMKDLVMEKLLSVREDTSRLLWHDEFQEMLATSKWNSDKTAIDDPVYWVPLIARLLGMRSEEILQLGPDDVRSDGGIPYIIVRQGTGQSLKSNNARRHIPIHSQLIELGFLKLVARQKALGKRRIFDKVKRGKTKKLSFTSTFTKKFTYYRKSRKVYVERRDLHALRTTRNSKWVAQGVPDTARRYLMGHKNDDVGIISYLPEGFPLKTLRDLIEQDQLDLSMITRRFNHKEPVKSAPRLATVDGENVAPGHLSVGPLANSVFSPQQAHA